MNRFILGLYYGEKSFLEIPKEILGDYIKSENVDYVLMDSDTNLLETSFVGAHPDDDLPISQMFMIDFDYYVEPSKAMDELKKGRCSRILEYQEVMVPSYYSSDDCYLVDNAIDGYYLFHSIADTVYSESEIICILELLLHAKYGRRFPEFSFEYIPKLTYLPDGISVKIEVEVKVYGNVENLKRERKIEDKFDGMSFAPFTV